jgi:ADP-heptose:LPS heptosyltransferase
MLQARHLLFIDCLLQIPYRMLWIIYFNIRKISEIRPRNKNRAVVLKFMGMGSIIRIASIWEKNEINFDNIAFCTFTQNKEVCELLGFKQVIYIRTDSMIHLVTDTFRSIISIRNFQPDYLIDLERCSAAVGLFRMCCGWVTACKTVSINKGQKDKESKNDIIWSLDKVTYGAVIEKATIFLSKEEKPGKREYACQETLVDENKILVNINASAYFPQRKYPPNHFVALILALQKKNGGISYQYYLTGSFDEYEYVQTVVDSLHQHGITTFNVAGKWNLKQLAWQLSRCKLFITNDSGPMHLSIYMQVPTIALWGPTHYQYFGYQSNAYAKHISLNKSCSPCFTDPTTKPAIACQGRILCMTELNPRWIALKAESLMKEHTSSYRHWVCPQGLLEKEPATTFQLN